MRSRRILIALGIAISMLLAGGAVAATGRYTVSAPDRAEVQAGDQWSPNGVGEAGASEGESAGQAPLGTPSGPQTDMSRASERVGRIVEAAGTALVPIMFDGDTVAEWDAVRLELPNGDMVDVSVQALSSVARPGSQIDADWEIGTAGPYEAAFEPRDDSNTYEGLWMLTERHQIGVTILAPPQQRLAAPVEGTRQQLRSIALRVAAALELEDGGQ